MSERKVLNKYYPPDFDPSKIPRMKLARNRQYTVRLMAPFNMRCKTCGEYIYKGKKFNARKEDVEGDDYLGIRIYRFYIKCTRCLQEISFKTDPKNTDYEIEAGATRNFMALKLAEEQAQREEDEEKEEEATNPMKLLEKRTLQSKQELELLESLEELKDLNRRQQTIDYDQMLEQFDTDGAKQRTEKEQEELDEEYIKSVFGKKPPTGTVVEEEIVEIDELGEPPKKAIKMETELTDCRKQQNQEKDVEEIESADISASTVPTTTTTTTTTSTSSTTFTWSDSVTKPAPKRTILGLVKRQATLGVKTNVNDNKCSSQVSNPGTEQVPQSSKSSETNTSEIHVVSASNNGNVHNGLSLLGAYTSSGSDSD